MADLRPDTAVASAEHYADDLEVELEEIMLADFKTETQDDSPRLVSKELVALHNELITGQSSTLTRLQQAAPAAVSTSLQQVVSGSYFWLVITLLLRQYVA